MTTEVDLLDINIPNKACIAPTTLWMLSFRRSDEMPTHGLYISYPAYDDNTLSYQPTKYDQIPFIIEESQQKNDQMVCPASV